MSNLSRTLTALRNLDIMCEKVEHWNQHDKKRHDLFGFIDILAVYSKGIIGVQCFGSDFSVHRDKILEEKQEICKKWLMSGAKIEFWGWRKIKVKRGGKAVRWKPRIWDVILEKEEIRFNER